MKIRRIKETESTNSYVASHATELEDMTMVLADKQTAGRGQRGNSWESEPGKNLTFTVFCRPTWLEPREQFSISEAAALAIVDYLADQGVEAMVKWPNDIYVGDRKIAGILIEHSVTSTEIESSRIGIGVNINQQKFLSDAPNPVSLFQIVNKEKDLMKAAESVAGCMQRRLEACRSAKEMDRLHSEFLSRLWRNDGMPHRFRLPGGEPFSGIIKDVDRFGPISILNIENGQISSYAFKEIEFILS